MAKKYSNEDRLEALKLAEEIGVAAAARRPGINEDTLYGWRNRRKQRTETLKQEVAGRNEEELITEITRLRTALKQSQQDVEILQGALSFFARGRRK